MENGVRLISKSEENPGRVFYKCPKHRSGHGGCQMYYWEEDYVEYLASHAGHVNLTPNSRGAEEQQSQHIEMKHRLPAAQPGAEFQMRHNGEMELMLKKIDVLIAVCNKIFLVLVALLAMKVLEFGTK